MHPLDASSAVWDAPTSPILATHLWLNLWLKLALPIIVVTYGLCSVFVLQLFYVVSVVEKKRCEIVVMLASGALFLQVLSVLKFLTAYNRCSLCPTVFYLGYILGLGSLSLLVFVWYPQLLQNQRYSGNTIDHW